MQGPISSTSSFRRFLLRILLPLIAIISAAGLLFNYCFEHTLVRNNEGSGAYKVNRILKQTNPDEIPVFGSSRAEGCIIPDSLGPHFFNYGLSGTKYDVTLFFLEEECKKHKATPWILLNLDLDGLLRGAGDIANYIPNASYPPLKAIMGDDYKPYFQVPFIKYYGRYETYLRSYLNGRLELTKVINKGAAIEKNVLPPGQFDQLVTERRNTVTTFTCDSLLRQKLLNIVATNSHRKFMFIIAPYHGSFFDKFTNPADAARFIDDLKANPNVKVLDFSKLPLPDSMFLNTSHINFKGALVFNHLLRDSLNAAGVR
jgi:hypothetical protein